MGWLDELETFNFPLTAQQVAAGYPYFGGNTTNMLDTWDLGVSDMLQTYVYGFPQPAATNSIPVRLGYWRFDSPLLYGEQGQVPLSFSNVSETPSWSGTALNISSASSSHVTYPDVGSNGWANFICEQGSVRFWFRPNAGGPLSGPFVYMGNPAGISEWSLRWNGSAIQFVSGKNADYGTNLAFPYSFPPTNWTQIVLTYGTNGSSLYTNGTLASNSTIAFPDPELTNRQLGLVIGNTTAYTTPINGQFEEMETFNYQLTASEIAANFEIVSNVDSNLDGIPDYLEDIQLATSRPFLGAPVVITGTIEAEQFDMGGPGIAYSNTFAPPTNNSYRPTGMCITNCTDLGGGYCLDQTQQNEWTQYTINVLVAQTYTIETRVAGIGNTGGVFRVEFTNSSGFNTNTGSLILPSTNWTTMTSVVYLTNGIYTMKLHCLTNAPETTNVGRFNYISVYPWWQPGFTSTNTISVAGLSNNINTWSAATNNSIQIQNAVNTASGQTVMIPPGIYYVAQASPSETANAAFNAAVSILANNIEIAGAGTNNTTLIAYNRATTVLCLGQSNFTAAQCANFTLHDITIEAQPHLAVINVTNTTFELGQLTLGTSYYQGSIATFFGSGSAHFAYNICITNCIFLHGIKSLVPVNEISNFMVTNCQFLPFDADCYFTGTTNSGTGTNAPTSNTTKWQGGVVGIFGNGPFNAVVIGNTYIGNSALVSVNTNVIGTNSGQTNILAPDGFVWFQTCGNVFVARNTISNNELEGVQLNAGPNSVVGNTFGTLVNEGSCCALNAFNSGWLGVTGTTNSTNYSTCFVGNSVYGGRTGEEGVQSDGPFTINFSGNSLNLYPAFDVSGDYPGAAVSVANCLAANVCGNALTDGGLGFVFTGTTTSALIINNNFGNAAYRGIGYYYTGDYLSTAQIYGNTLGEGASFHVQLPCTNSFGWFFGRNATVNTNSIAVPLFADPASSDIHILLLRRL